ncbi:MAG: HigA family addiction module antitoxin [Bacteroidia bacterium]
MNKINHEWEDGLIGSGSGLINPNSEDFRMLKEKIINHSAKIPVDEKIQIRIKGLKYKMETYLKEGIPETIIPAGVFLKEFIEITGVSYKDFAAYIGCKNSNLSALLSGARKINYDVALKLGHIFNMEPEIWLNIQNRGELWEIHQQNATEYQKYQLADLLKKAG